MIGEPLVEEVADLAGVPVRRAAMLVDALADPVPVGVFEGRMARYESIDSKGTAFDRGCFDASLAQRLPPVCWMHDPGRVVGRVFEVEHRESGRAVVARAYVFDPDVWAAVRSGRVARLSVSGFYLGSREPTDAERARQPKLRSVITRVELTELSVVPRGACPGAEVLLVTEHPDLLEAVLADRCRVADAYRVLADQLRQVAELRAEIEAMRDQEVTV